MKAIFAAIAIALGVGCTYPVTDPAILGKCGERPPQEYAERVVSDAVRRMPLKDPGSAQVEGITITGPKRWFEPTGNIYGWEISFSLNAKNSYGGYTGFSRHLVLIQPGGVWLTRPADAWHP